MQGELSTMRIEELLYREQFEAFYCPDQIAIVRGVPVSGKTYGAMHWIVDDARRDPITPCWYVVAQMHQARLTYERLACIIGDGGRGDPSRLVISMWSSGTIHVVSPTSIPYGTRVGSCVVDGGLGVQPWREIRQSTVVSPGWAGRLRLVGGLTDWDSFTLPEPHHVATLTAATAIRQGLMTRARLEDMRSCLTEERFKALYEGRFNE